MRTRLASLLSFLLTVSAVAQYPDTLLHTLPSPVTYDPLAHAGRAVAVSGNLAAVGDGTPTNGIVKVFDVQTGMVVQVIEPPNHSNPGFGDSLALSGTRLVVGAPLADGQHTNTVGVVYVYELSGATPSIPTVVLEGDVYLGGFGSSVSLSGDRVVVGEPQEDRGHGRAFVFDLASSSPSNPVLTLEGSGHPSAGRFGICVAISGNRVAVGETLDDTGAVNAGKVSVFDLSSPTAATPIHVVPNPAPSVEAGFGQALSLSGNLLVVGAPQDDSGAVDAGSAYLFDLGGGTPTLPFLTWHDPAVASGASFGSAVSIAGSRVIIGASGETHVQPQAGRAYVYDLAGGSAATPSVTLENPSPASGDHFGAAVAVAGAWAVVGAPEDDAVNTDSGITFSFNLTSGSPGTPMATLSAPELSSQSDFGESVAVSGSRVVVGAPYDPTRAVQSGSVYIYDQASGTPTSPVLALRNPGENPEVDRFGTAVAIDGSIVVVGAYNTAGGGVVYVFDVTGATPTIPIRTLSNPSGGGDAYFGMSVAISGNRIVVGAYGEGVSRLGAVYVYDLTSATPTVPRFTLNNPGTDVDDSFGSAVSISGPKIAVGAFRLNAAPGIGHAYVYDVAGSTPTVPVHTLTSSALTNEFGRAVVIAGNRLIIGAPGAGQAFVYDLSTATPTTPVHTLFEGSNSQFGVAIALSGNLVAIGAPYTVLPGTSDRGRAYLYDLTSATPATAVAMLDNPRGPNPQTAAGGRNFSSSVALWGSTLAVGASDNRGVAYVYGPPGPVAIPGGPYQVNLGQALSLDGTGSYHPIAGRLIVSHAWDLDDDGQFDDASGASPTLNAIQFANIGLAIGTHTIHLRVTDNFGATSIASTTLTEEDGVNAARFTFLPHPAACNQVITFDGSTSVEPNGQNIVSYVWDFGDGGTATGMIVNHAYAHFGNYAVKLTITNDHVPPVSDSQWHVVTVNQGNNPPTAVAGGPYNISEGQLFALNGSASSDPDGACGDSIVEYAWDLDNDGHYDDASGATVVLASDDQNAVGIASPGVHPVKLRVKDSLGLTATASSSVTVAVTPLTSQVQHAVALAQDVVVVGAPNEQAIGAPSAYGTACVLRWDGSSWIKEADILPSNPAQVQKFGHAVAISGDLMIVGAPGESSAASGINGGSATTDGLPEAGAVYVFKRSGGVWTQQALIKPALPGAGDHFGAAVAMFGDTLVVSAPDEDSAATRLYSDPNDDSATNSGAVYVFVGDGSNWSQQAFLKANNTGAGDRFGTSVAVSGDMLAVGASFEDSADTGVQGEGIDNSAPDSGAAYVFRRYSAWIQEAYLKASNTDATDEFGRSVAVSGARVIVGAPNEDSFSTTVNTDSGDNSSAERGAAYVFVSDGAVWAEEAYVKSPNGANGDRFGASVTMVRGRAVIGVETRDGALADSGAGYAFEDSGSGWAMVQQYAGAVERANDRFGGTVAILNDVTVFGAAGLTGAPPNTPLSSGGATIFRDATWAANAPPMPNMRTQVTEGSDLTPTNVTIVSETAIDAGHYLFELSHDLLNAGTALWRNTGSAMKSTVNGVTFHVLRTAANVAGSLGPGEVAVGAAEHTLHVVVNAVDEAEFVALITTEQLIQVVAKVGDAVVVNPVEAVLQAGRVLAVTTLASGQKLIEFTADVRNAGTLLLRSVELKINTAATATPFTTYVGGMSYPGTLSAGESATGSGTCYVMCDQANAAAARAALLNGSAIEPKGEDVMTFGAPNYNFDATTMTMFSSHDSLATETAATLVFNASTPVIRRVEPGDLITEDTSGNDYYYRPVPVAPDEGTLSDFLPLLVKRVIVKSGRYNIIGERVNLINVARSGTFTGTAATGYHSPARDPFDPPLGNTFTNSEKAAREAEATVIEAEDASDGRLTELRGYNATPVTLKDFHPIPGVDALRVSGEINISAVPFAFQMQTRDFGPKRIIMRSEVAVDTHLVIECDTGIGTQFNDEKQLFPDILLPKIKLGEVVTIQPLIYGKAGASVNIPDKITVPFEASSRKGMIATWNHGLPMDIDFYEEHEPLHLSSPEVFKEFGADLSAFVEVGAEFEVHPAVPDIASFSVSVGARPTVTAQIRPFANPWWSLNGQLSVMGGFGVSLDFSVFEFPIYEHQSSLRDYPLFSFNAGAPLIPPAPSLSTSSALRPLGSARNLRWGRTLVPGIGSWNQTDESWIIQLTDGTMISGWEAGIFSRFTADGELLWTRVTSTSGRPIGGIALEDNTFMLFQQAGLGLNISRFDANGNRLWVKNHSLAFAPNSVASRKVPNGPSSTALEYFVGGSANVSGSSDGHLVKFDAAGNVLWAKRYPVSGGQDLFNNLCILSDNNLVAVGSSEVTVGTRTNCGLVMKVNATTGNTMWATSVIGPRFKSVTEGPDGSIYALGDMLVIITHPYPPVSVARFTPEGLNTALVQIGADPDHTSSPMATAKIATAGNIVWANGGLYACGHANTLPRQSWMARLDEKLSVTEFVHWFSETRDILIGGLGVMSDGIAIAGNTNGGYPWPAGGTNLPVLLKLPWECLMRFHQECPLRSQFLRPRVYRATDHPAFLSNGLSWVQSTVIPVDSTTSTGVLPIVPPLASIATTVPLEYKDLNAISSFADWAAYYQLVAPNNTPVTDSDGDGVSNGLEAYFGLDPYSASIMPTLTMQMETIGADVLPVLEFQRASYADTLGFGIETSTNLLDWTGTSTLTTLTTPVSADMEDVWIYNPAPEARRFYRASSTPPASP